jgi:hypothetical protein
MLCATCSTLSFDGVLMMERRTDRDGADQKAHGTHGRGKSDEQRIDEANVEPDAERKRAPADAQGRGTARA